MHWFYTFVFRNTSVFPPQGFASFVQFYLFFVLDISIELLVSLFRDLPIEYYGETNLSYVHLSLGQLLSRLHLKNLAHNLLLRVRMVNTMSSANRKRFNLSLLIFMPLLICSNINSNMAANKLCENFATFSNSLFDVKFDGVSCSLMLAIAVIFFIMRLSQFDSQLMLL